MKSLSTQTKVAAFFFALLASTTVLGGTVAAMQSGRFNGDEIVALERTIVVAASAPAAAN